MTRYLDVKDVQQLCAHVGIERLMKDISDAVAEDFRRWPHFQKNARLAHRFAEGVIELMPISDAHRFSFKYVNGHPNNPLSGLPTVMAFGVLSDVASGYPLLLSELTLTTALRTASSSALAASVLARPDSRIMALIGTGAQSEFQAVAFMSLLGIREIRIHDTDPAAMRKFAANLERYVRDGRLRVVPCASAREAVNGADIVTTLTANQANAHVLTEAMVAPGMHINAVGGDSPGKTELERSILERAHVFVEFLPQTRVEGEIQQVPGLQATEIWEVLTGASTGRTHAGEITVFDSVGFALEDFSALRVLFEWSNRLEIGSQLNLVPTLSDPKNLFNLVLDAPLQPNPDKALALMPCM